jgi:GTP-binding protein
MRIESAEFLVSAGQVGQFPRTGRPEVAFSGRSNVGKSSLINRLLGRRKLAHTSSTPGRTQTINFYLINQRFCFVDLPGYGYAKVARSTKQAWWALVERYLIQRQELTGVVHLVDARHEPTPDDRDLEDFLRSAALPSLVVLTKADKVGRGARAASAVRAAAALGLSDPEPLLFVSAESGEGMAELWRAIREGLESPARDGSGGVRPGGGGEGSASRPDRR